MATRPSIYLLMHIDVSKTDVTPILVNFSTDKDAILHRYYTEMVGKAGDTDKQGQADRLHQVHSFVRKIFKKNSPLFPDHIMVI